MPAASRSEKRNRGSTETSSNRFRVVRVERTENFRLNKAESVSNHGTLAHKLQASSCNFNHRLKYLITARCNQ
jgi:hypothetical protein